MGTDRLVKPTRSTFSIFTHFIQWIHQNVEVSSALFITKVIKKHCNQRTVFKNKQEVQKSAARRLFSDLNERLFSSKVTSI